MVLSLAMLTVEFAEFHPPQKKSVFSGSTIRQMRQQPPPMANPEGREENEVLEDRAVCIYNTVLLILGADKKTVLVPVLQC